MFQSLARLVPALILLLILAPGAFADIGGLAIDPKTCLECHEDVVSADDFASSVHGRNACTSCHTDASNLEAHINGEIKLAEVDCLRCHKQESAEHFSSIHKLSGIGCGDCHNDLHTHQYWEGDKNMVVEKCSMFHDGEAI